MASFVYMAKVRGGLSCGHQHSGENETGERRGVNCAVNIASSKPGSVVDLLAFDLEEATELNGFTCTGRVHSTFERPIGGKVNA